MLYLDSFSIALCNDASVADLMQFQSGSIHWNIEDLEQAADIGGIRIQ
jgi:hypothetical protein